MKTLDHYISATVNPWDEESPDQEELTLQQYLKYKKDIILNSIGFMESRQYIDLFLDEVIEELPKDELKLYLEQIANQLILFYSMDVLQDYISQELIIEEHEKDMWKLLKFFESDRSDGLISLLPKIKLEYLGDHSKMYYFLDSIYEDFRQKVINRKSLPTMVRYFAEFAAKKDFLKCVFKIILRDIPGLVAIQLVNGDYNGND